MKTTDITRGVYNGVRLAGNFTQRIAVAALQYAATLHVATMFSAAEKQYDKADKLYEQADALRAAAVITSNDADAAEREADSLHLAAINEAVEIGVDLDRLG